MVFLSMPGIIPSAQASRCLAFALVAERYKLGFNDRNNRKNRREKVRVILAFTATFGNRGMRQNPNKINGFDAEAPLPRDTARREVSGAFLKGGKGAVDGRACK
jgi:hypothetical protein